MWEHIIKNGRLVSGEDIVCADIYIKDGKIAAISSERLGGEAKEVTDAAGKYVLPGFIDTHVHSREGQNGAHDKEDFFHSTAAAAVGGVTTLFEMPNTNPAIYNAHRLHELLARISPQAHVDFCVWGLCLGDLNKEALLPLSKAGVVGFKYFWGYAIDKRAYQLVYNYRAGMEHVIPSLDQGEVYDIFREVKKTGKRLAIHAENFDIIKRMTEEALKCEDRSYAALLKTRPAFCEQSIIEAAILFARHTGTPLHILHVASGDSVKLIARAKAQGLPVTAETCPQYLCLTDEDAKTHGARMKGYPLVRTARDQALIWEGLKSGAIDYVASDHAPHLKEEKQLGLFEAPAGIAGLDTISLLLINAVSEKKITLSKLVSILSETPARLYGLYPKKGSLSIGADADIVIVDMEQEYVFSQESMRSKAKISPYHGKPMKGKPIKTLLRGQVISSGGVITGAPRGQFLHM